MNPAAIWTPRCDNTPPIPLSIHHCISLISIAFSTSMHTTFNCLLETTSPPHPPLTPLSRSLTSRSPFLQVVLAIDKLTDYARSNPDTFGTISNLILVELIANLRTAERIDLPHIPHDSTTHTPYPKEYKRCLHNASVAIQSEMALMACHPKAARLLGADVATMCATLFNHPGHFFTLPAMDLLHAYTELMGLGSRDWTMHMDAILPHLVAEFGSPFPRGIRALEMASLVVLSVRSSPDLPTQWPLLARGALDIMAARAYSANPNLRHTHEVGHDDSESEFGDALEMDLDASTLWHGGSGLDHDVVPTTPTPTIATTMPSAAPVLTYSRTIRTRYESSASTRTQIESRTLAGELIRSMVSHGGTVNVAATLRVVSQALTSWNGWSLTNGPGELGYEAIHAIRRGLTEGGQRRLLLTALVGEIRETIARGGSIEGVVDCALEEVAVLSGSDAVTSFGQVVTDLVPPGAVNYGGNDHRLLLEIAVALARKGTQTAPLLDLLAANAAMLPKNPTHAAHVLDTLIHVTRQCSGAVAAAEGEAVVESVGAGPTTTTTSTTNITKNSNNMSGIATTSNDTLTSTSSSTSNSISPSASFVHRLASLLGPGSSRLGPLGLGRGGLGEATDPGATATAALFPSRAKRFVQRLVGADAGAGTPRVMLPPRLLHALLVVIQGPGSGPEETTTDDPHRAKQNQHHHHDLAGVTPRTILRVKAIQALLVAMQCVSPGSLSVLDVTSLCRTITACYSSGDMDGDADPDPDGALLAPLLAYLAMAGVARAHGHGEARERFAATILRLRTGKDRARTTSTGRTGTMAGAEMVAEAIEWALRESAEEGRDARDVWGVCLGGAPPTSSWLGKLRDVVEEEEVNDDGRSDAVLVAPLDAKSAGAQAWARRVRGWTRTVGGGLDEGQRAEMAAVLSRVVVGDGGRGGMGWGMVMGKAEKDREQRDVAEMIAERLRLESAA